MHGDPNKKLWRHPILNDLHQFNHLHHIYHKDKRVASTCPDLHLDLQEHPHLPQAIKHMLIRHIIHTNRITHDHPYLTVPHEPDYLDHLSDNYTVQILYDDVTGKPLDTNEVWKARYEELGEIQKNNVYTKVPIEDCMRNTGKKPIAVRWVDINKGDDVHPNYRSRIVAKELKSADKHRDDLFAATPPLEAKRALISMAVTESLGFPKGKPQDGMKLDFIDVRRAYYHAHSRRPLCVQLPEGDKEKGHVW